MPTEGSLSFTQLVLDASLPVQLVMLFLLILSVFSWTIIFQKISQFKKNRQKADEFEDKFWSGIDLNSLYQDCIKRQESLTGLEVIYAAGFKEFVRLVNSGPADQEVVMDGTYRQMKVASNREIEAQETHLTTLATIGSISPYIGLFGTVWGIMHAFVALAAVKNATLAMVAPPIAEALIATAMGLFAAIPAVMCYNRFASRLEGFENRYLNFMDEFATILNRRLVTLRSMPYTQAGRIQSVSGSQSGTSDDKAVKEQDAKEAYTRSVVPPRSASHEKAEAKLPEHAAVREKAEFELKNDPMRTKEDRSLQGAFSRSSFADDRGSGAPLTGKAENLSGKGEIFVSPGGQKPKFNNQNALQNSQEQAPLYKVGVAADKQAAGTAGKGPVVAGSMMSGAFGTKPSGPYYQSGASAGGQSAGQLYRSSTPTGSGRSRGTKDAGNVPPYQVGPRPLSAAELAKREQSLSEEPQYLKPGVNGDRVIRGQ